MRIHCTDDDDQPIMDLASALDRAEHSDFQPRSLEISKMATRKSAPAAEAKPAEAAAKPAKKTKGAAAPAPAPEPEKGTFGPRAVPDGHVGLNTLAEELGISPAAARRKLRASDTSFKAEGQHGYYWKEGSKDLAAVRKYLTPAKEEAAA